MYTTNYWWTITHVFQSILNNALCLQESFMDDDVKEWLLTLLNEYKALS